MNWKRKQVLAVTLWSVIIFSMLGCIGQQYSDPQETITLPPQTITQTSTMPGTVIEVIIPPETVTLSPEPITVPAQTITQPSQTITQPSQTITLDPITTTADPLTVTSYLPVRTVIQTVTMPPTTVEVPVTTTESTVITVTTQRTVVVETTIKGDPVLVTTTLPVTLTTTRLVCPTGYTIKRGFEELGCITYEEAKDLGSFSFGSDGGGFTGVELLVVVGILGIVVVGLRKSKQKK